MSRILRVLGAAWVLPVALLIWVIYIVPLWLLGWIDFADVADERAALFTVTPRGPTWWLRRWEGWAAHTLPFAIVARDTSPRVIRHELRHADQWLLLGPLFPLVYLVLLMFYSYRQHPLELDATRHES